jgi:hypothetical protein
VGPTGTAGVVNVKATQAQPDSVTAASRVAIDAALLLLLLLLALLEQLLDAVEAGLDVRRPDAVGQPQVADPFVVLGRLGVVLLLLGLEGPLVPLPRPALGQLRVDGRRGDLHVRLAGRRRGLRLPRRVGDYDLGR